MECSLQVRYESLPRREKFKYLEILITSDSKLEREMDRWIGALSAVIRVLCQFVIVKRELGRKANLLVHRCQSPHLWSQDLGHDQKKEVTKAAQVSFPSGDEVWSSPFQREFRVNAPPH